MNELVEFLTKPQRVINGSNSKGVQDFKDQIDRGYVFVKFTETKGGTDLGVRMDPDSCDISKADFEAATGSVHIEGDLELNYVKVRCKADINLENLEGEGYLVPLEDDEESAA
ncbi:MbtH domain protein [Exilibacterium tricleocarpae]|uniref:MbtH domain protein n=1 Tax=Exilibacterium tricleocarpae TaxID=2591008 RepID=A0A545SSP7_9GAMM|nr:MbtH domain protein [Exilibacterium tricleocarpae]TQV67994.1 MbtH domain protein [Exilibacterium tricleocarpae]